MEYFWWLLSLANVLSFVGAPRSDPVNCLVILSTFFKVFHSDRGTRGGHSEFVSPALEHPFGPYNAKIVALNAVQFRLAFSDGGVLKSSSVEHGSLLIYFTL